MKIELDIDPKEFIAFFKAMTDEMKRHSKKKGDSWKDDDYIALYGGRSAMDNIPIYANTEEYLQKLFKEAIKDYFDNPRLDQLIDISNIAGMLWCRGEILRSQKIQFNIPV